MAKDVHYTDPSVNSELPEYDGEVAADYVKNLQPIKDDYRRKKRNRILASVLFFIIISSMAGYFIFFKSDAPVQQQVAQSQQIDQRVQVVKSEKFVSQDMNLSFEYPSNWSVDDSAREFIRIESSAVKLTDINKEQSDAKIVITFLNTGSEVSGFGEVGATAVRDSERITYSSPSQSQRAKTYLSFASFGRSGLDAIFVTGDSGYQVGQLIPESDIKKGDPIISVAFYGCSDVKCSGEGAGPYTIQVDDNKNNEALQPVWSLLRSLRVE